MKNFFRTIGTFIQKTFKETDKLFLALCAVTSVFGILMVWSATLHSMPEARSIPRDAIIMGLSLALGLIACMILSFIDYEILMKLSPLIYIAGIGLMLLLIPFGVAPDNRTDAVSWFKLGPIFFQPSEILKIGCVITFATHLSKAKETDLNSFKNILLLGLHAAIPILLVIKPSGDIGSAIVFMLIFVSMMFAAGVHWGYFAAGGGLVAIALPLVWTFGERLGILEAYHKSRFLAVIYPDDYADDMAYQQLQGQRAMGSGGIFGKGLFKGDFTQTGSVPVSQNDMILSVIGEELGLMGILSVFSLLFLIIWRIISIGKRAKDTAAYLMCWGFAALIAWQAIINIGMAVGLLPVIGITLPFFSGGGSATLTLYLGLGVVLGIARSTRREKEFSMKMSRVGKLYGTNLK